MRFSRKKHEKTEEDINNIIMGDFKKQIKDSFGKMLLKRAVKSIISLISAAKHCSNKRKFWKKILKENPSSENLHFIKREILLLSIKAQKELKKRYPEKKKKGY